MRRAFPRPLVLVWLGLGGTGHGRHPVYKLGLEQNVSVGEHAVLQRDHHKLQRGETASERDWEKYIYETEAEWVLFYFTRLTSRPQCV